MLPTLERGDNDATYALRRLRKDRPDIHARVLAGEITANAGMVEAGLRKKGKSRKQSLLETASKAVAKLNDDEWEQLRRDEVARRKAVQ